MTGLDDEDGPEFSGRPPHPDDRLWRHPSEMAAEMAAQLAAEQPTVELAVAPESKSPRFFALASAAVLVGTGALVFGVLTAGRGSSEVAEPSDVTVAFTAPAGDQTPSDALAEIIDRSGNFPRVQAATGVGLQEGAGFFVTDEGHLATSLRLIEQSEYVVVWTDDGRRLRAEVIASDPVSDIAILKTEYASAPAVFNAVDTLSASRSGIVGVGAVDHGLAPGDPATRLRVAQPGVGGAPVVDAAGQVIAMVNHAGPGLAGAIDESAATPAWMIERVVSDLLTAGETEHPWLGIAVEPVDVGAVNIVAVVPGSPAERAGLRVGDVIDQIDETPLGPNATLWSTLQAQRPGDEVKLVITRTGNRRLVWVTLGTLAE